MALPKVYPWVFSNARTEKPFKSVRQVFGRACERAGIDAREVTLHTLRHTALSRMIARGFDDLGAFIESPGILFRQAREKTLHFLRFRRIDPGIKLFRPGEVCGRYLHRT